MSTRTFNGRAWAHLGMQMLLGCTPAPSHAAQCFATVTLDEFPHCALLAPSYALHWKVLPQEGAVRFAAHVDGTPAWIGRSAETMC